MTKKQESPYQIALDFLTDVNDVDKAYASSAQKLSTDISKKQPKEHLEQKFSPAAAVAYSYRQDTSLAAQHILPFGTLLSSPGGHFTYRVLGACCRLFDREELPWPCCRIQWRSKEPSWRRIGKRFVPDLATKRFPSYIVEILDQEYAKAPFVLTLYWISLPLDVQQWWYRRYIPLSASASTTKNL